MAAVPPCPGDGTTDDTKAVQAATAALQNRSTGVLYFPTGLFLLTGPVVLRSATMGAFDIRGDGWGSVLLWAAAGDCLVLDGVSTQLSGVTMHDFAVASVATTKSVADNAIK